MDNFNSCEAEIKELKKQLKKAERKIRTLESNSNLLAEFNKKAMLMRDISEQELRHAKELAERADQAKGDFLASMSHEIRTPINAVLGMNELIMRETTEKNIQEYAQDIKNSGKMLLSIINDILDFSKIESGKMEIIPVEYDVATVVNDIINMLGKRAADKNLDFIVRVDKETPSVLYGDEIRIRQIITNLMTNAIKYTQTGSVTLSIGAAKHDDNTDLLIDVIDTGKGIKEEDQGRLFDSFTRVDEKENRAIEGTGLGLALTKSFVDMMNGELSLKSVYGEGSTFSVRIPQVIVNVVPVGDFEERIKKNHENYVNDEYDIYAPGCKVLVVDDVAMNIKVLSGLLKNSGMEIDSAQSGYEALEKCSQKPYNLIFMDHRMPNMDGIECFRKLRENDSPNRSTPVIVLTANALSGMREMYVKEGFADYLTKPVEMRKLEAALKRVIPEQLRGREASNSLGSGVVDACQAEAGLSEIFPELDIETGLFYCMDDENFYKEMLEAYVNSNQRDAIRQSLREKNYRDFKTYVHGVKSTSMTIGAVSVSEKAKALELAAKEEKIPFIEENFDGFMKEYEELLAHISRECARF